MIAVTTQTKFQGSAVKPNVHHCSSVALTETAFRMYGNAMEATIVAITGMKSDLNALTRKQRPTAPLLPMLFLVLTVKNVYIEHTCVMERRHARTAVMKHLS